MTSPRILVILYKQERDEHDIHGRVIGSKGTYVSHGINIQSGKTIILPQEKWENFRHLCTQYEGEWYLK